MRRYEKILLVILIIVLIYAAIFFTNFFEKSKVKKIDAQGLNTETATNNYYENNVVVQNKSSEETVNKVSNNIENTNINTDTNKVVGNEEKESKEGSTAKNEEETAIELAKKEWGISIDSYNFESNAQGNGIYIVIVRSKSTGYTSAIYKVDVKAGTVTE